MSTPSAVRRSKATWAAYALCMLVLLTFAPDLSGRWAFEDDYQQVVENPHLEKLGTLPQLFSRPTGELLARPQRSSIFRPVYLSSFYVDRLIFGLNPFFSHLLNNLIHLLNVLLLFVLFRRTLGTEAAFFASALFAVHPVVSEPVAWVSGRHELLSTSFALGACLLLTRTFTPVRGAVTALLSLAAMFTKETAAALIALAVALSWIHSLREPRKSLQEFANGGCALAGIAIGSWVRRLAMGSSPTDLWAKTVISNALTILGRYAELLFFPWSADLFSAPIHALSPSGMDVFCLIAIILGSGILAWRTRHRPFAGFGIAVFLGTLLPVALVADLAGYAHDRYFYLPHLGICAFLAVSLETCMPRMSKIQGRTLRIALLCAIAGLSVISASRARLWTDMLALLEVSMKRNPEDPQPYVEAARYYRRAGNRAQEMASYAQVLSRSPNHAWALNAHAVRLMEENQLRRALEELTRAYQADPRRAQTAFNLGVLFENGGHPTEARKWYERTLTLQPGDPRAIESVRRLTSSPKPLERKRPNP